MDDLQKMQLRMQCLDLAVQVCKHTGNIDDVISSAEKYWKWLNGSHEAGKTPRAA